MRQPFSLLAALAATTTLLAQVPQPRPAEAFVLAHVNVVDVVAGTVRSDQDVAVKDGRIESVGAAAPASPARGRIVDATGKFLVPGLADMHVHWSDERYLGLFVANGVTTVREMRGAPLFFLLMGKMNRGQLLGPRMVVASPLVDGPPATWPNALIVPAAADAPRIVDIVKGAGYDFVKVDTGLSREAYLAVAAAAKAADLPVAGPVPYAVNAGDASDAGHKSIEHVSGILLAASSDEARLRDRAMAAFKAGEAGQSMPGTAGQAMREVNEALLAAYDPAKASALFARFVKNGTWQCPTLTALRSMGSLDDAAFAADPRGKYMPKTMRDAWNPASEPRNAAKTAADYAVDKRLFAKYLEVVGAMHKAGVRIIAGTDTSRPYVFPGFSLHDELALLVQAGLSPADALRAATINPAIYLGAEKTSGTIEAGKDADLVLLDASPLDDIGSTKRIHAVVARGHLVDRAALDAILANAEKISR